MAKKDIRWVQRFTNFKKALERLAAGASEFSDEMSDLEKEGLIQRFEYTFELAWKTLQDLLEHKGYIDIKGPTPVIKQALQDGFIQSEKKWRKMKEARELTAHTYDEDEANEIATRIVDDYVELLLELKKTLDKELKKN